MSFTSKQSRLLMTEGGLSTFLKTLPREMTRDVKKEVRAWANSIRDEARRNAPVSTEFNKNTSPPGTLKKAIRSAVFNRGMAAKAGFFGKHKRAAYYAFFVEYGTKPHYVSKSARRKSISSRSSEHGGGMHPGQPQRPFIRPAILKQGKPGAERVLLAIRRVLVAAAAAGGQGQLVPADQELYRAKVQALALKLSDLNVEPFTGSLEEQ